MERFCPDAFESIPQLFRVMVKVRLEIRPKSLCRELRSGDSGEENAISVTSGRNRGI